MTLVDEIVRELRDAKELTRELGTRMLSQVAYPDPNGQINVAIAIPKVSNVQRRLKRVMRATRYNSSMSVVSWLSAKWGIWRSCKKLGGVAKRNDALHNEASADPSEVAELAKDWHLIGEEFQELITELQCESY